MSIKQKQVILNEIIKFKNAKFRILKASDNKVKYLGDLSKIDLANLFTEDGRRAIHESDTGYGAALIMELRLLDLLKNLRGIEASLLGKLRELDDKLFEQNNTEIKDLIKRLIWLISFKSTAHKAAFDRSTGILWLILLYYNIEKEEYILSNELEHLLKESEIEKLVKDKLQSVIADKNKLDSFLKFELRIMNLLVTQVRLQISMLSSLKAPLSVNVEKSAKNDVQVLVIGGGIAGISTAYHLSRANVNAMVVEAGRIGIGSDNIMSGTLGLNTVSHSKCVFSYFPESNWETYVRKNRKGNGKIRARTFLEIANSGAEIIKRMSNSLSPSLIRQYGSIILGGKEEYNSLKKEFLIYKSLPFLRNCRFYSKKEIYGIFGTNAFEGGIFFPNDAIVDSVAYVRLLKERANIMVAENVKVIGIKQTKTGVAVKTARPINKTSYDGTFTEEITADYVVIATNGFLMDMNLRKAMERFWTFQLSYRDNGPNSPNTAEVAEINHWWARQDNVLFVGGEDEHVVGDKFRFPRTEEKAKKNLIKWANEKFPQTRGKQPLEFHFGICAEISDETPLVGRFSDDSRIFYIVG